MMGKDTSIKALVVESTGKGVEAAIRDVTTADLPKGEVLVSVRYSSLNYKDGLAVTGGGKVIRRYPMVPGIDLAGVVVESRSESFKAGDEVIATGWGLGEEHWGGYAQAARLPGDWLLPLPAGLTLKDAMAIGTAGLTAMLSVMALEARSMRKTERPVLVTGAGGGVGSLAIACLAARGYRVAASTGRRELHEYLKGLGAEEILDRAELSYASDKGLEHERWSGAIDTVGGNTLATILRTLERRAGVAVCGLAGGSELHATVFPFLLRGVAMIGIASSSTPREDRAAAWARLAAELPREVLRTISQVAPLTNVPRLSRAILQGQIRGRVVIDLNA